MIWTSIFEHCAQLSLLSWISLVILGSTFIDIALQAKGSISSLAIKELFQTIQQVKQEKLKHLSTK